MESSSGDQTQKSNGMRTLSMAGMLITLGIIFGDIGTSPLYTLQTIIGNSPISTEIVLGGVSAIFWTLTLQTTLKYVFLTLKADNQGEGGIFALYTLVKKLNIKWLVFIAMIGGAALIADGVLTPAISITSAVEGLKLINPGIPILPIVITIVVVLFALQRLGTQFVGKAFGPVMFIWFLMIGILGGIQIASNFSVLAAINPYYAYHLLVEYPQGFWFLGAVFLATTDAEAHYSDLGHCGRPNIRVTWGFVKTMLLLSYFGQAAWALHHQGELLNGSSPFYLIMPQWFLITGIIIATLATVIASQALINGTFTIINEAMRLKLWPKIRVIYPTLFRGQMFVPSANIALMLGCIGIILHFRESANMTIAYGFTIILAMMMTSILLVYYMILKKYNPFAIASFALVYTTVEGSFFVAQVYKIFNGGWIVIVIALILISIMLAWYYGHKISGQLVRYVPINSYLPVLSDISKDESIPKYASNLVFLLGAHNTGDIESSAIDSIIQNHPKRADIYWFVHVDVVDEPYRLEYKVTQFSSQQVIRIDFKLGFKIVPLVNLLFHKVVADMVQSKQLDITSNYPSLKKYSIKSDFHFIVFEKYLSYENQLPLFESLIINMYFFLKWIGLSPEKAYGLDESIVTVEKVPVVIVSSPLETMQLSRVD